MNEKPDDNNGVYIMHDRVYKVRSKKMFTVLTAVTTSSFLHQRQLVPIESLQILLYEYISKCCCVLIIPITTKCHIAARCVPYVIIASTY